MTIPVIFSGDRGTRLWKIPQDAYRKKSLFMEPLQLQCSSQSAPSPSTLTLHEEYDPGVIFLFLPSENWVGDSNLFIKSCEKAFLTTSVTKPWGSYTVLQEESNFKVKCILVNPRSSLSLQSHKFRSEHWIVLKGKGEVINGDKEYPLEINETTFIPMNAKHRLTNPGTTDLLIIEVQVGTYLGEEDIIRYEDLYDRV